MPEKFGEVLIQVYTKEGKFMGLVQAAYRHVFRSLPIPEEQSDITTIMSTPPATQMPSTPRMLPRTPSVNLPSTQGTKSFQRTASLSENKFTTIPPNYQSRSPSRMAPPMLKRSREASVELDIDNPPPTRKSMRLAAWTK